MLLRYYSQEANLFGFSSGNMSFYRELWVFGNEEANEVANGVANKVANEAFNKTANEVAK